MKSMRYINVLLGIVYCSYIMSHFPTYDHEEVLKNLATSIKNNDSIQCDRYALLIGSEHEYNESLIKYFIDMVAWKNVCVDASILYSQNTSKMHELINNIIDYCDEKVVLTLSNVGDLFSKEKNRCDVTMNNLKHMLERVNKKNNLFLLCTVENSENVNTYITNLFKIHIRIPSINSIDSLFSEENNITHVDEKTQQAMILIRGVAMYESCYFD